MSMYNGDILRVCGRQTTRIFRDRHPPQDGMRGQYYWPFDGLVAVRDGWIAVSGNRLYRYADRNIERLGTPPLHVVGGIPMNQNEADYVVVLRACCWGSGDGGDDYGLLVIPVLRP